MTQFYKVGDTLTRTEKQALEASDVECTYWRSLRHEGMLAADSTKGFYKFSHDAILFSQRNDKGSYFIYEYRSKKVLCQRCVVLKLWYDFPEGTREREERLFKVMADRAVKHFDSHNEALLFYVQSLYGAEYNKDPFSMPISGEEICLNDWAPQFLRLFAFDQSPILG